jgi:hypothetical protein
MTQATDGRDRHDRTGAALPEGVVEEIARLWRLTLWRSKDVGFSAFCRRAVSYGRIGAWCRAGTERTQVKRETAVVRYIARRAWAGRYPVGRWVNELVRTIQGVFADVWRKVRLHPRFSDGGDPMELTAAADVCRTLALAALYGLGRGVLGPPLVGRRVAIAWAPSFQGIGRVLRRALAGQIDKGFASHAFYESVLACALVEAGLAHRVRVYGGRCPVCERVCYVFHEDDVCPQCRSALKSHKLALVLGSEFLRRMIRATRRRRAILVPVTERPYRVPAGLASAGPLGPWHVIAEALTLILDEALANTGPAHPTAALLMAARTRKGTRRPFTPEEAAQTLDTLLVPTKSRGRLLRKFRTQRRILTGFDSEVKAGELRTEIDRLRERLRSILMKWNIIGPGSNL